MSFSLRIYCNSLIHGKNMQIAIYGAGYVGLVTSVGLAQLGHHVTCVDIDESLVADLNQGLISIYEPDLQELLQDHLNQSLFFTTDARKAIACADVHMIAVGTPALPDGGADLRQVEQVAKTIAQHMDAYCLVVTKSTVPVGTADRVADIITQTLERRLKNIEFDIASNPEFLREGCAVTDFLEPERIIVGINHQRAKIIMEQLYQPLINASHPIVFMPIRSAELTKYAANAFLATKISFMNEISQLAERYGADITDVKAGMALDGRISEHFLNAGCGYGGSCFPKDVSALIAMAHEANYQPKLLQSVAQVNDQQQRLLFDKITLYFNGNVTNKVFAIWGLAFKPNTDDIRCASSLALIRCLIEAGARVQAYDPVAMDAVRVQLKDDALTLTATAEEALINADALVLVTEWDEFLQPNFASLKIALSHPVIFDGRNIYNAELLNSLGIEYYGVGRGRPFHPIIDSPLTHALIKD